MISKEEKKVIVGVLGSHYSIQIIEHLQNNGYKPKKAPVFTANLIQQIMNAHHEDDDVEFAILSLVQEKKREKEKLAKKRQSILKK